VVVEEHAKIACNIEAVIERGEIKVRVDVTKKALDAREVRAALDWKPQ
jgi:hypothetical protein